MERCRRQGTRRYLRRAGEFEPAKRRVWARPGRGAASARTVGTGLRVVHGGVRHSRSEGGEGTAGGVGSVSGYSRQPVRLTQSNVPEPTAKPLLDKLSLFDAAPFSGRHRLLSVG